MRIWLVVMVALTACRRGDVAAAEATEPPPVRVRCQAVQRATVEDTLVLRGRVAPPPLAEAVVASTVPGRVARLLVAEGDLVVAHQLIAQIEDPTLGAASAQRDAEVDAAMVELRSATAERIRNQRLLASGIVAEKELDDARVREEAAQASLRAAEAGSKLARRQLARTDLRAPHAGTVLRVFKRAGELLDGADTAVAELADLSVLELRAQVTGVERIGLTPGTAATVELDAAPGLILIGEVVAVSPTMDPITSMGTVRVRLTLPAGLNPAIGLSGSVTVGRAPRLAVQVPPGALRRSIEGRDEALVCAPGHIEVHAVELGVRAPDAIEIRAGLAAGDRVVVDHVLGLEDGAAIVESPAP